jgi:RNA polymerase sigma-70 factor (ECF subfamily)
MLMACASFQVPDRDLAEELCQQTFIRAWERLDDFDPARGDFATWLRAICRSLAQGELTRRRRERHNRTQAREALRQRLLLAAGDDAQQALDGDRLGALRACQGELSPRLVALLTQRYHEGASVAEAAAHLGTTVTWVTTTLSRLRERLRECVERRLRGGGSVA